LEVAVTLYPIPARDFEIGKLNGRRIDSRPPAIEAFTGPKDRLCPAASEARFPNCKRGADESETPDSATMNSSVKCLAIT